MRRIITVQEFKLLFEEFTKELTTGIPEYGENLHAPTPVRKQITFNGITESFWLTHPTLAYCKILTSNKDVLVAGEYGRHRDRARDDIYTSVRKKYTHLKKVFLSTFKYTIKTNKKELLSKRKPEEIEVYVPIPRLGRGDLVGICYGVESTDVFKAVYSSSTTTIITVTRKSKPMDYVLHSAVNRSGVVVLIKDKKVAFDYEIQPSDIVYLANNGDIDSAWDALYPCNRIGIRRKRFPAFTIKT